MRGDVIAEWMSDGSPWILHFYYAPRTSNYMQTDFERRPNEIKDLGNIRAKWGLTAKVLTGGVKQFALKRAWYLS